MSDTPRVDAIATGRSLNPATDFTKLAVTYSDLLQLARELERALSDSVTTRDELARQIIRVGAEREELRAMEIERTKELQSACDDLKGSTTYAGELEAPARELLYLYDWRPELAKHEADPYVDQKWLKKQLREYGERKKAGWTALRAALSKSP